MASNPLAKLWRGVRILRAAYLRGINEAYQEEDLRRRFPHVLFGQGVIIKRPDRFYPGRRVALHERVYLNCAGGDWNQGAGFIRMGDNCEIAPYVVIWGAGGVTIGANVHIGDHVSITAHEALPIKPEDINVWKPLNFNFESVVIEDHVLIYNSATIIPGVHIGHHAVIGAGAVVIRNVPPCCLVAGVPARIIRELRPDEGETESTLNPLAAPEPGGPAASMRSAPK